MSFSEESSRGVRASSSRAGQRSGAPSRLESGLEGWPRRLLALTLGATLAFSVACISVACNGAGGPGGKDDKLEEALIKEVSKGDLVEQIIESGKITAWFEVKIKSRVSGEVKEVLVEEGQAVTKGQLLMVLDDVDYKRQVSSSDIDLREARLRLRNAEIELERNKGAFDARGISKFELDKAQQNLELARVNVDRAAVALDRSRDQVGYTKIYAPMDGRITARNVEPGEVITAGITATVNGEPLLTIAQLDKMRLELSMNQVDVARVKVGQKATVTLDAWRDKPIEGEVSSIAAAAHTDTTKGIEVFTVKIAVDPSQSQLEIKPGMTAEVKIHVGTWPQVVKVPLETVFEEDGKSYIYVVKDDPKKPGAKTREKQEITLGHRGTSEVEVAQGLEPGQKIYTKADNKDLEFKM